MRAGGIDIITRLYDLADLPGLDRLLFSVIGQSITGEPDATPLHLHLMLHRFSVTEVQRVREAMRGLRRLGDRVSVTLHNWDYPAPFDLSVPLLNWGLEVAQSRYVMCLDIHDQLHPSACAALLARLHLTPAVLSLGAINIQSALWWGDVMLPVPNRNIAPHPTLIFMADRDRLAVKDCVFRSGEPSAEISELIHRLSTFYEVDSALQKYDVAIRQCPASSFNLIDSATAL